MGQTNTDWITSLWAVSRDQFIPKIEDNVFNNFAMLWLLKEKSQVGIKDGGLYLQVPLMVSANTGVDSYTGYDQIDTSPQKGFIDGQIVKAYYAAPITISKQEQEENSSESQVVNLLTARTTQTEDSMNSRINTDLYLDGTGHGGKNLTGLLAMVPSASGADTYMGITSAVSTWKHQYNECASANIISGASGLDQLFYKLSDGAVRPDLVITDDIGIALYEGKNRQAGVGISYVNAKFADAGFVAVAYKGMPMVLDQQQGTGVYHMLTSKYLGFYLKMDTTDFVRPANQMARVAIVDAVCQLVTNNRRRQGKLVLS